MKTIFIALVLLHCLSLALGHARLRNPPSRATMWRHGYQTAPDYNDNEGFCGGFDHQWLVNGGRCGICGDAFDAYPRPHEAGGTWGNTRMIVGQYSPGQWINVEVEVTTQHRGHFVFKVCQSPQWERDPEQDCFDRNGELQVSTGGTHYEMLTWDKGTYYLQVKLPDYLYCEHCIFQWTWTAGNNWGQCPDGTSGQGCGNQETFRACSDISVK